MKNAYPLGATTVIIPRQNIKTKTNFTIIKFNTFSSSWTSTIFIVVTTKYQLITFITL
jgi:hypothetical protein